VLKRNSAASSERRSTMRQSPSLCAIQLLSGVQASLRKESQWQCQLASESNCDLHRFPEHGAIVTRYVAVTRYGAKPRPRQARASPFVTRGQKGAVARPLPSLMRGPIASLGYCWTNGCLWLLQEP